MRRHGYTVNYHNTADAYRHFIGNFYMTRELGLDVTRFVSYRNEVRDRNAMRVLGSRSGVTTALITGGALQDIWNDVVGQNSAILNPNLDSTQAFNLARSQGRLITDANNVWVDLGLFDPNDPNNTLGFVDTDNWRVVVSWDRNNQTITFFGRDNNRVTMQLGGVLNEERN